MKAEAHILVVDDEPELRTMLSEYLGKQGFEVSAAAGVAAARKLLDKAKVDLVVLDLRMPGEDGLSFARELRAQGGIAIVILTASGSTIDRVVGLEVGADDYLGKPFDPRELLARIRSVLRRIGPVRALTAGGSRRACPFGRFVLDLDGRRLLTEGGEEVPVTSMEFDLMEAFAQHPNRVLSRDRLLALAHRATNEPFDRSIDIRVARLRQKIELQPDKPQLIRTVRGAGYIFVPGGNMPTLG